MPARISESGMMSPWRVAAGVAGSDGRLAPAPPVEAMAAPAGGATDGALVESGTFDAVGAPAAGDAGGGGSANPRVGVSAAAATESAGSRRAVRRRNIVSIVRGVCWRVKRLFRR